MPEAQTPGAGLRQRRRAAGHSAVRRGGALAAWRRGRFDVIPVRRPRREPTNTVADARLRSRRLSSPSTGGTSRWATSSCDARSPASTGGARGGRSGPRARGRAWRGDPARAAGPRPRRRPALRPRAGSELLAEAGFPAGEGFPDLLTRRASVVADRRARRTARRDRRARALRDPPQVVRRLAGDARVVRRVARRLSRPGRVLPRPARAEHAVLPRRRDQRDPRAGARLARPRRSAAAVPRVRAALDRPARGDRADLVCPPARPAPPERARPQAQPDGRVPPRAGRDRPGGRSPDRQFRIANGSIEETRLPWMSAACTSRL